MAHDAARAAAAGAAAAAGPGDGGGPGDAGDGAPPGAGWTFERLLRELVDARTYPRLHAIAWSGEIGENPSGFDEGEEFLLGVDTILDGVAALIARCRPA